MLRIGKKHKESIDQLMIHWARFYPILPYHREWIERSASYTLYPRGACIYDVNWKEERIFYITEGIIARVDYYVDIKSQIEKRVILSVGLPQMALMTTDHLYSKTQGAGQIIALRSSKVLSIDYDHIKRFTRDDQSLDKILNVLANKKKRQLARLRQIDSLLDPQSAYIRFAQCLPELYRLLSQTEQKDLLGISRSSIQRASYFLLTGKNKR
jgi:hypothetical protein